MVLPEAMIEYYTDKDKNILDLNPNWEQFERDYSPLTKIKLYLVSLSEKYGLGKVSFKPENKYDWDSIDSFYIEAPEGWDYEKTSKVWDELIEDCVKYAEKEGIISTLNSLAIIVK